MAEESLATYRGNCHCAAFVYTVKLPEIKEYTQCNCSICHKKGYSWVFPGSPEFVHGSLDQLTAYTFNDGHFKHLFCPTCGTPLLSELSQIPGDKRLGFNIRAVQNVDVWKLKAKPWDGKALPGSYRAPIYKGPEPSPEIEDGHTYHGSCHCGAVTMAVKSSNSACRNAADEKLETLSDHHKAWWKRVQARRNITLRCLNNFDCSNLNTRKLDGWSLVDPIYENP
ncbi:hypothetical protein N0V93_005269 [Gnomoniopsis smithogilvyi]|uniref:CENP-V/GFA domain-containing protein n=1 Tax=Gnomoniopsis smithogilvyi TaxID=1191159 RepID=A0A9W8YUA0_9PEZI|nr:hypothetical protein N0V93_005269 [Gnomoniopsis smithogilvyi]